jgi:hypothetical protein
MSKKESESRTQLILGILGFLGVLITGVLTIFAPIIQENLRQQNQVTPVLPTAVVYTETVAPTVAFTDTVPPNNPTSTPEPPTPTPQPIPTSTLIPVGADWAQNCMSSLWVPYPSSIVANSDDKGCLIQPVDKFYTTTGRLAFSFDGRVSAPQIYGMFAKLPSDGTVRIDLKLITVAKGEILMGVFASPDVNSNGVMVVIPASSDVTRRQKMILKIMPGQRVYSQSVEFAADPPIYDAFFDFTSGNISVQVVKDQIDLGSISVVSGEKWLFLGYQVLNGTNTLQAEFQNLVIESR